MGSGHADFSDDIVNALKSSPPMVKHFPTNQADLSDEIVNALKSSPLPMFKHFPPNVPLVSGPTTRTLSQHLSWQKQTRGDENISKDTIVSCLAVQRPPLSLNKNKINPSILWTVG